MGHSMNIRGGAKHTAASILWGVAGVLLILLATILYSHSPVHAKDDATSRLITVYDRGEYRSFLTTASTLAEALDEATIELDARDTIEPALDEELIASEYHVNIYRARPVFVVDGATRTKVMTPYQTATRIAQHAGITLYPEDKAVMSRTTNLVGDGAGLEMTITRAIPFTLDLYGRKNKTRTQGATIAAMLQEKGIVLGENGRTSQPLDTPITAGMQVRVWQEGKQTTSVDEPVAFPVEHIYDADRVLGYTATKTVGVNGVRTITYEIEIKDGKEIARKEIARILTTQPVKQVEIVGIKGMGEGLTKAKGAIVFTDSNGVRHRETYYDLNMSRVMQACGQGGKYSVRIDGVKVDSDGYVIIAANLVRYPRCSVVETSVGPGKVYDTGGFAAVHPDGFDIATDWSRNDGI